MQDAYKSIGIKLNGKHGQTDRRNGCMNGMENVQTEKRERKMRWTDERASEQSASVTVTVTVWMDEWCELLAAYVSIYCIVVPRKSNSVGCCHPVTQSCSQASNHPSNQPTTVASYHIRQSPQCNAELWITQWIWLQQVAAFIFTFHTPLHPPPSTR